MQMNLYNQDDSGDGDINNDNDTDDDDDDDVNIMEASSILHHHIYSNKLF